MSLCLKMSAIQTTGSLYSASREISYIPHLPNRLPIEGARLIYFQKDIGLNKDMPYLATEILSNSIWGESGSMAAVLKGSQELTLHLHFKNRQAAMIII